MSPVVLVVDDEPDTSDLLVRLIRRLGFATDCCACGEEAVVYLASNVPSLILLDQMMPGMSGISLLAIIRGDPRLEKVPVVFLTAVADTDQLQEQVTAGNAQDVWRKGMIDYSLLPQMLAKYVAA